MLQRRCLAGGLTQHMLDRIAKHDPRLESYATNMHAQALADARAAQRDIAAGSFTEQRSNLRCTPQGSYGLRRAPPGALVRFPFRRTPTLGRPEYQSGANAHLSLAEVDMAGTPFAGVIALLLLAVQLVPISRVQAQVAGTAVHGHLTEVACVDVPPGERRPEFGCFNVGVATGLQFSQTSVYWHLHVFPTRVAAEAAKSATGIVVEEDGRVWLSEFGRSNAAPRGGKAIAAIGPLRLSPAKSYSAVLSYAVMRPGDNSRVHTHAGPEGWYVLAGEQCLETPDGARRARAGGTMTVRSNIPMELNVTGQVLRRAFALVIHDSAQPRGTPSDWKPSGLCGR